MKIQPYLHFDGTCAEALEYYKNTLGAKIDELWYFRDMPKSEQCPDIKPEMMDKVMHATFRIGNATLMASDCGKKFEGFSLTCAVESEDEADRIYNAIASAGTVIMQIGKTFFAERYGMVTDRYGLTWQVIYGAEQQLEATA